MLTLYYTLTLFVDDGFVAVVSINDLNEFLAELKKELRIISMNKIFLGLASRTLMEN